MAAAGALFASLMWGVIGAYLAVAYVKSERW